jgi:xylose isomerase
MNNPFIGKREYFPGIGQIAFEGRDSDNPLAFKHYDAGKKVGDKTMAEHLRFAVCYWHSFVNAGHDPFGPGTRNYPWDGPAAQDSPLARAEAKLDAAFEFFTKLGVRHYCFHDINMAPDAEDIAVYEKNLGHMVALAKERQKASGVKLL